MSRARYEAMLKRNPHLCPASAAPPVPPIPTVGDILDADYPIPLDAQGFGHLYVVEIVGVCVKVGISRVNPQSRIASHRAMAGVFDREFGRTWTSRRTPAYAAIEAQTIKQYSHNNRCEWLKASYDEVLHYVRSLSNQAIEQWCSASVSA